MRIGFLFNHHGGHQVAHALPVAFELQRQNPEAEVSILVSEGCEAEVRRLAAVQAVRNAIPEIIRLRPPSALASAANRATGRAIPADIVSVLHRNLDRFRKLDALVVPEKTSLLLKSLFGLKSLRLVHTRHGAGDRAIGFDKASGKFDLVLLSGEKIRDRLAQAELLKEDGHAIVGYPKFDLPPRSAGPRLFPKDRPTVVYNPHPSPALSSWYAMGPQILDWFAKDDRYNLIFAPHIMLFKKRLTASLSPFALGWNYGPRPDHYEHDHMLIDTGSAASLDMTYTDAADIYIGDASSQVYEFIRRPRPCIFLNPRRIAWQGNPDFAHWRAGTVVETMDELAAALAEVPRLSAAMHDRQEDMFRYSFDLQERPSSERAAEAILSYMARQ
ncbi:CDP-glycerol glycerophosphotransferase family protein [Sphingopyxis macrogoltabida]|uniref:Glycerophosphotransferase n=1 Tax=Sphingopyxis macrogoltabida TaxID=33050 RepID=A0AAC8Z1A7_SPHMC|nr:CDP-glycerol glycerophosphotransferase family protein [Sphingopyxis macrogoltabida]ALJ12487.1 hypothetical protein LH19_06365 [Sphingopyxis macrogoltabida]AMU90036.1 hypothetical protein ATM17_13425 [Sphingopyxis macrogoltabida]